MNDNVYFADYGNHCIRKIDSNGVMSDVIGVCGSGGYSGDGAEANNAQLFIHQVLLLIRMETCSLQILGITSSGK